MATPNLTLLAKPNSAAAEAFRTLRTQLTFSGVDRALHTLLITSAAAEDGKSAAVANLAVAFAQAGNKTILVDCDLRKPTQHTIWGVDNRNGLSALLTQDTALANPPLVETGIANLSLLPTGDITGNPADLLSRPRMGEIIGILKARADYVLFDCPPVLAASDAMLLGAKVDGTLLIVRAGHTRQDHIERAKADLTRAKAHLLGAVLTNTPRERQAAY